MTEHVDQNPLVTAAILEQLIAQAPELAQAAHALLSPVAADRDTLRQALLDAGQIIKIGASDTAPAVRSIVAVDGGLVREQLYAADLLVAVAASAEGMTSTVPRPLTQRQWATVRAHEPDNGRLSEAAMASLEVTVIADLDHDLRIIDGSHGTPVIAMSTALASRSHSIREATADLVTDEVLAAVATIANRDVLHETHPSTEIIALPKSDSSHLFADTYRNRYDLDVHGADRFLAAQVLQPGEMLKPRVLTELAGLHVPTPQDANRRIAAVCAALDSAVQPLKRAAQDGILQVTYLKPDSAETVVKMEFRDLDGNGHDTAQRLARMISDETPGPFLQEPYAQYSVDLAAKAVSAGADALNQALIANLPEGAESYLPWLVRSYRTQQARGGGQARPGVPTPSQPRS